MKVKIMQRSVYHKYAEIEINIPEGTDTEQFLLDNEDIWSDKMDDEISKAKYEFGNGMDTYDWTDKEEDNERMYLSSRIGGHL